MRKVTLKHGEVEYAVKRIASGEKKIKEIIYGTGRPEKTHRIKSSFITVTSSYKPSSFLK